MLFLLDSSAILNRFDFAFAEGNDYFMPPKAMDECKDFRSRNLVEAALQSGLLKAHAPSEASIRKASALAAAKNVEVSAADLEVCATALDLRAEGRVFTVLTDDFTLQSLLQALKLPYQGVFRGEIKGKPGKKAKKPPNNVNL